MFNLNIYDKIKQILEGMNINNFIKNQIIIIFVNCVICSTAYAQENNLPYFRVKYYPEYPPQNLIQPINIKTIQQANTKNNINKQVNASDKKASNPELVKFLQDDKRTTPRFKNSLSHPVKVYLKNNLELTNIIDISRGGLGFKSQNIKAGDEIPITIQYKNMKIPTKLHIISNKNGRVSSKFVPINEASDNKLLYLSILLEKDHHILFTKLTN